MGDAHAPSPPLPPSEAPAAGPPADGVPVGLASAAPPSPAPAPSAAAPEPAEDPATSARVLALLRGAGAAFSTLEHAPTRTSQESADVRGVPLASGAKAMLLRAAKPLAHGGHFVLAVMSAARTADMRRLRAALGVSRLAMASVEEVRSVTGCIPGAVPPFGSLFPGVATLVDASVEAQGPVINFNAGLRTLSVVGLPVGEYLAIERPLRAEFTSPAEGGAAGAAGGAAA